ncbi:Serine/threonine-protein kinase PknB [Stieleria maiorica]|uniref:Serine/threonine-protein kinase PknB n=1 Tax=Stieleria maiorica TaxID=2795974 RepID=A0A5B9MES2_9BACT|nr:serine/threonine-protein kinase [Stieleria maiorica]QEF98490.1 Serine/threonine-protein kinase PknB [Stieleria maiorica]
MAEANDKPERDEAFDRIVHEYYRSIENGESIPRQAFINRHREFEQELHSFFADLDQFDQAVEDREVTPDDAIDATHVTPLGRSSLDPRVAVRYIGEYRVLSEVARGGMGIVFKARQESLRRTVALKMILSGRLANEAQVERFYREARSAAALKHPRIVAVHEIGKHEGHHYFTMDFIEGESLAETLREDSLPPRRAAELVATLADAIHFAHQRGVLHRDLKPANVLLDGDGQPHITDFGLSKPLFDADADLGAITYSGQILGTPRFMAPEQAAAEHGRVGVPSDVYSLGAILYTSLVGRAPFVAESTVETIRQVIEKDPVRPRLLNPAVPKDLETICLKCLEKVPESRYRSAADLRDDLRRFLDGHAIHAKPIGWSSRAWKWCRRRPEVASLLSLLMLALLTGLVAVGFWWRMAEYRRAEAEKATAEAKQNLYASLIGEAEATRRARLSGYRSRVLALLQQAFGLTGVQKDDFRIRQEAILCFGDFVGNQPTTVEGPELADSPGAATFLDDQRIAVAVAGGDVVVRDVADGSEQSRVYRIGLDIRAMAMANDGSTILMVDKDSLERWDQQQDGDWIRQWECPAAYSSHYMDIGVGPDQIALIDRFQIRLIGLSDGEPARSVQAPADYGFLFPQHGFLTTAISPDQHYVAAADSPESVFLWDAATGELVKRIRAPGTGVPNVQFSTDGQFLVVGSDQGFATYRCDDFSQWSVIQTDPIFSLAVSADATRLITVTEVGAVHLWNLLTGRLIATLSHPGSPPLGSAGFSPGGTRVFSCGAERLRIWSLADTPERIVLHGHQRPVNCVAFHPSTDVLASGSQDGTVRFWDTAAATELSKLALGEAVKSVKFSVDGSLVAAATSRSLVVWQHSDNGNLNPVLQLNRNRPAFNDIDFSPDGRLFASCGPEGIQLWEIRRAGDGTIELRQTRRESVFGQSMTFDASSKYIAVNARLLFGWIDLSAPGSKPRTIAKRVFSSNLVASPKDQNLIAVSADGTLLEWHIETERANRKIAELGRLSSPVIAISPSGDVLAVQASHGNVRLLDLQTRRTLFDLADEHASINAIKWAPGGRRLAIGLTDGGVAIWDLTRISEQLVYAGLSSGLERFKIPGDKPASPPPTILARQVWQPSKLDSTNEVQAKKYLASWGIETRREAIMDEPSIDAPIDQSIREEISQWHGGASRHGAFVLGIPGSRFEPLAQQLSAAGYGLSSISPVWSGDQVVVSAGWHAGDFDAVWELDMSAESLKQRQQEMTALGYRLADVGGYVEDRPESIERFYALWRNDLPSTATQWLALGETPQQAHDTFHGKMNDYEPILRQCYYDADNQLRYCELWEQFDLPALEPWFAYTNSYDVMFGEIRRSGMDRYPCRSFKVSRSHDENATFYSGVWRSDETGVTTRLVFGESPRTAQLVGTEMLHSGYRPRCVSMTASHHQAPVAAVVWEKAMALKN